MLHALVAQNHKSAALLMRKIRVGDLAGVPLSGVTVIATANPCKIERVGAIPSISTNFLRGESACHIGCVR